MGKAQSAKASSIVLILSQMRNGQAVPLKSPATSNFLRNQNGTKSKDETFGDSFLLGVDVGYARTRK